MLRESRAGIPFESLRKEASAGVDRVTYVGYAPEAWSNIEKLHDRLKAGQYRAQPLRRIYILKEDGRLRPISIPSPEDKIVQKAVAGLLDAIYEQDFLECSYGFRPGRGPQDALDEVGRVICRRPISTILEADITGYFDAIVRSLLKRRSVRREEPSASTCTLGSVRGEVTVCHGEPKRARCRKRRIRPRGYLRTD